MINADVPHEFRDYCVDFYIAWRQCKVDNFLTTWKCDEAMNNWNVCLYRDRQDRLREYERERRLLIRKVKKEAKEAELALAGGVEDDDDE